MCVGKARSFKKDLEPNPSASGIYSERCVFYAPLAGIEKHFLKELINSSIDSFISPFFQVVMHLDINHSGWRNIV